jgi:uncharacterized protein with beta-barrel porin domain
MLVALVRGTTFPALAAGGAGGTGNEGAAAGGAGGTGFTGNAGSVGTFCFPVCSGGSGGGGAGGGNGGGTALDPSVGGGAGGTAGSPNGQNGSNDGDSGGGGGGGFNGNGAGAATMNNSSALNGGNGGNGGDAVFTTNAGGGGGGAGGYGAIVTGSGVNSNTSTLTAGNGGAGGAAGFGADDAGGNGGDGGVGVQFTATGVTFTNSGTVSGGHGGAGGGAGAGFGNAGAGGAGGAGIAASGDNVAVSNTSSGTITGGSGGNGINGASAAGGIVLSGSNSSVTNLGVVAGGNGGAGSLSGGSGGAGIVIGTVASTGNVVANSGSVSGGSGAGNAGGGAGIRAVGTTITDSGTIMGGLAGNGLTRNRAVSFVGGTNVLELQAGYNIIGNAVAFSTADTLRLGGAINASFDVSTIGPAAQYQGFGNFAKVGTSIWRLTGTNAAALAWTISAGTLNVTGAMAASIMTVGNGGTLAGNGTVGAVTVNGGGTFAPGSVGTVGTMTVTGNLAFQSGAIYFVQLNSTTASIANMGGTATLTGANVQPAFTAGGIAARTYDILHAAGGLGGGTFAGVTTSNPNFSFTLTYSTTDVFLTPSASLGLGTFLNQNQQAVANGLTAFFNAGGALPPNFSALFGLTGANLAGALTQATGELATDAQTGAFQQLTEFLNLMNDPAIDGRAGTSAGMPPNGYAEENAYASKKKSALPSDASRAFARYVKAPPLAPVYEPRWNVWAAGYGGYNKTNGDPVVGSNDVVTRTGGGAAGADYHFSPNALVGFALAGGGTSWGLAQGLGTGDADVFQAGLYGKGYIGPAYIAASIAFADNWMRTNRTGPFGDQLQARFNGQNYGGRLESGYRFAVWPSFGITPYAAVQAQSFHTPAYSEADLTFVGFGLSFPSRSASDTRSEVGARFDTMTALNNMPLTLRARLAWAHDWITNPSLNAVFETLPGVGFTVNGAAPAKDRALASLGADLHVTQNWTLAAKLDGEFASRSQTYAGTGIVRYSW